MAGMMDGTTPPGLPPGAFPGMPPRPMPPLVDMVKGLYGARILSYLEVAAAALFMYDYVLTLGMEINLVWVTKWNFVKVLYIAQRYMPFFDAGLVTIYRHAGTDLTKRQCEHMTMATGVFTIVGTIASEVLLTIRIWALWNRDRAFAIGLTIGFIGIWTPAAVVGYLYTISLIYPETPPYPGFLGCFVVADKPLVVWCWLALLVWDLLCLVLMAIPGFYSYRVGMMASSTRLTYVVYRDGTAYYGFLFVMSTLNIVFSAILPATSRVVTMALTRCLHSMLASRVVLQLRVQSNSGSDLFPTGDDLSLNLRSTHVFDEDIGMDGFAEGNGGGGDNGRRSLDSRGDIARRIL